MSRQLTPSVSVNNREQVRSRNLPQKTLLVLAATALVIVPLWLALRGVHAAPSGPASPVAAATPSVTINAPSQALIGTQVKFNLKFTTGNVTGYGPFIDLVLDAGGANAAKPCPCDGITFVSAKLVGVNGGPITLPPIAPTPSLTAPCGTASANAAHSFATSGVTAVNLPAGGQLITLALPFGSVVPNQPPFEIEVTANISNLADVNYPLKISARAGYRYGGDALDNSSTDAPSMSDLTSNATGWSAQAQITPAVMIISKSYLGPEGENATGPGFLNYYPLRYKLTVTVAPGQTITNVNLSDCLPANMAFHSLISVTPAGTATLPPIDVPSPSGCLNVHWNSLTGGAAVIFDFFIPEKDAAANFVLPTNCKPAISKDTLTVTADWVPLDSCDTSPQQLSEGPVVDTLLDKCLAIQKSVAIVTDTNAAGLTPGDTLMYTLKFQVSDYKTIGSLVVNDMLANGQDLVSPVTLSVTDQFGTKSGVIAPLFISQQQDPQGAAHFCPASLQKPANGTVLTFKVSAAMAVIPGFGAPRLMAGIMTGGYAAGITPPHTPATGVITFRAKVRDDFQYPVSPADTFVDKEDPINNCVAIQGKVLQNMNRPSPINAAANIPTTVVAGAADNSATGLMIIPDTLKKQVIAVKRGSSFVCGGTSGTACANSPNPPQEVRAGDQVTFSLTKKVPSSDAEQLTIEDWLPLPVFNASGMTFTNLLCSGAGAIPAANTACLGPADQMHTLVTPKPSFTVDATMNSIKFDYSPNFNDPNNQPRTIELRFTSTVTNLPFADNLYLTNEAQECEANTFGDVFCQTAIAQINLREPKLRIQKGIIATDNPKGNFTSQGPRTATLSLAQAPAGVSFSLAGVGGTVNSAALATGLLNSDLSNADANDTVTFVVTVENVGGADAFNAKIEDIIPNNAGSPTCFTIVPNSFKIKRGDGWVIPPLMFNLTFPTATGGFIVNANPGVPIPKSNTTGTNIVVITFQAKVLAKIQPGCCDNEVYLRQYSSQIVGPNFVTAGFTPPFLDTARVCVDVKAAKCITKTSEAHTLADNSATGAVNVAIGEIVRYQLWTKIPEGVNNFLAVTDNLPASMTFMNDGTTKVAFVSDGGLTSVNLSGPGLHVPGSSKQCGYTTPTFKPPLPDPSSGPFAAGASPSFFMGLVTNADNDGNEEFVVVEFNALVNNLPQNVVGLPNQNGVTLSNVYQVFLGKSIKGQPKPPVATSNASNVIVVEPHIQLTKTATPSTVTAGSAVTFTITATNNGTAHAFDVVLTDTLPPGLTFMGGSLVATSSCASPVVSGNNVNVPIIKVGCTVTVTFKVKVTGHCPSDFVNKAYATYTSLPANGTITAPNLTGSITPGASGAVNGERQYQASATAVVVCMGGPQVGSLTVIKKITSQPGMTPPSSAVFPVTVSCLPSGYSNTLNLSASVPTQTFNNIPLGSTCTVTEAPLPPSVPHPACATAGWFQPIYTPSQTIAISGTSQSVTILNKFGCLPSCATPPANMVAWWPLDETSGNVVHSIVGNHDGTTLPGPIGGGNLTVASSPKVGSALFFGAAKVEVPDDPALDFGTGDFSIDAWVRSHQSSLLSAVVDKLDTSTTTHRGYAFFVQGGMVQLRIGDGVSTATYQSSNTFVADGTWRHVAVTIRRVGGTPVGQFYIDGAPAGPSFTPLAINLDNNAKLLIGHFRLGNNACSCEVSLDEIELFNAAVSASDIRAIFNAGPQGKCRTSSLIVKKTITAPKGMSPPSTAVFPVTVSCQPSGYNQTLNLSPSVLTQTFTNVPSGNTCTVTEGPLPAPFANLICPAMGWSPPTYTPSQTVAITGPPKTVTLGNRFGCLTNSKQKSD